MENTLRKNLNKKYGIVKGWESWTSSQSSKVGLLATVWAKSSTLKKDETAAVPSDWNKEIKKK